jgi:hypothetical protein
MTGNTTAKLFMHGRSQAVRLPKEFRLPGTDFLPEGRPEQPPTPVDDRTYFDDE